MKKLLLFFVLLAPGFIPAQTATSVQNGNWTNPMTWDCSCVPLPGYTITINHNVTLNTSFAWTTGGITVNAGGSLLDDATGRDLWMNGGNFSNGGSTDVHYFLVQSGTFSNSGTITARAIANYVNFTNTGTFQQVDSLYNTATVINNGSFLAIDSVTNAGTWTNNGTCTYNQFTNTGQFINNERLDYTDITNTGTLNNADTISCANSMWNTGMFINQPNSYVLIGNSLLNQDPAMNDAVINNNGRINVLDSWYNMDTVKGQTGNFIVQDTSLNFGFMKGYFDFCDLTPPMTAPYVDFNTGTITPGITWCANTAVTETAPGEFSVCPNPADSRLFLAIRGTQQFTATLINSSGAVAGEYRDARVLDIEMLPPGIYLLRIETGTTILSHKIMITR